MATYSPLVRKTDAGLELGASATFTVKDTAAMTALDTGGAALTSGTFVYLEGTSGNVDSQLWVLNRNSTEAAGPFAIVAPNGGRFLRVCWTCGV